jgi:hypothetical protein
LQGLKSLRENPSSPSDGGEEERNCRSLGFARDDKVG